MNGYECVDMNDKLRKLLDMIFTDDFIKKNTNFENFKSFRYSSAVIANWDADQMIYSRVLMDHFVNESTRFKTWDEMVRTAADERFMRKENNERRI